MSQWGILNILNDVNPDKKHGPKITDGELGDVQNQLTISALRLVLEELQFDEKCLQVHLTKIQNYQVRLAHQKEEWMKKRQERSRQAVISWWDQKATFRFY